MLWNCYVYFIILISSFSIYSLSFISLFFLFFFLFSLLVPKKKKKTEIFFFFCYIDIFKFVSLLNFVLFNFLNNHPKKNSRSYHGWLWPFIKLLGYVLGRFSFSSSTLTSLVLLEIGWALRWWWVSCSSHLWWDLVSWFPSRFSY